MARKPKTLSDDEDDMVPLWPMTDSYTTADGLLIKVYRAAYAVAGSNKFSARPKGVF